MAVRGQGASLKYTIAGASEATVENCTKITAPKVSYPELDFTNLATTGNFKEYIVGMTDGGEVSFECLYSEATLTALNTIKGVLTNATGTTSWKITGPEATSPPVITFNGYLKELSMPDFSTDEVVKLSGTVKVCGAINIA